MKNKFKIGDRVKLNKGVKLTVGAVELPHVCIVQSTPSDGSGFPYVVKSLNDGKIYSCGVLCLELFNYNGLKRAVRRVQTTKI